MCTYAGKLRLVALVMFTPLKPKQPSNFLKSLAYRRWYVSQFFGRATNLHDRIEKTRRECGVHRQISNNLRAGALLSNDWSASKPNGGLYIGRKSIVEILSSLALILRFPRVLCFGRFCPAVKGVSRGHESLKVDILNLPPEVPTLSARAHSACG